LDIDDIANNLNSAYVAARLSAVRGTLLDDRSIVKMTQDLGLSRSTFFDEIALRLALGFHRNIFDFGFCDQVINELHAVITVQDEDRPELFWDIFLAFDAGEYHRKKDLSDDPVEEFTRPQITEILRKHNAI
jgi:hypothetical protein